ncbi:MAG: AtpZ/AtpI family protein [Chloroflexota bacterium]
MNEQRSLLQALALFGQLGVSIALPLAVCTYGGYWLDGRLNRSPLFLLVGLAVGGVLAFYIMVRMLKDAIKK